MLQAILNMPVIELGMIVLVLVTIVAILTRFEVVRDSWKFIKEALIIGAFLILVGVIAYWLMGYGSWLGDGLSESYDAIPRWGD